MTSTPAIAHPITLTAIAIAAFTVADVAHEALGHGGACLALGGRVLLIDTTFEDCSIKSRWIDGAGPMMGILVALFALAGARVTRTQNLRLFLVLLFAFAAFWNVGYMIKSGLRYNGDWHFAIEGLEPTAAWHIGLAILGVVLYIATMRVLVRIWPTGDGMNSFAFALTAYLAAIALCAAGGAFDPKGHTAILTDALPSALASLGLVLVGMRRTQSVAVPVSFRWIGAGLLSAVLFVAVLGPGVRF